MNKEFFEILTKNILYIENIKTGEILRGTFDIKEYIDKYSSLKKVSYRLFLNNESIITNDYFVIYNCNGCGNKKKILLKRFLTKKSLLCKNCMNKDEIKINKQKDTWKRGISPKKAKIKKKNIELIEDSNTRFGKELSVFKKFYYKTHLTEKEFEEIKHQIYSIDNIVVTNDMRFMEHIKINNQMLYSQFIYDIKNDILISMRNIKMICENCDKIYNITRKLKEKLLYKKSLCKKCYLSNRIFKIKNILNIDGDKVIYQTNYELKLINFCNKNKILILNGPVLQYFHNNKYKKYYIDFYIPKYKLLIELKDQHIWHKDQIDSGVWTLKERCARQYAKENDLEFKIIFSQDFDNFLNAFKI